MEERHFTKSNAPLRVFFRFLKLYQRYQIAQRISMYKEQPTYDPYRFQVKITRIPIQQNLVMRLDRYQKLRSCHSVKSVLIRSYSGPHFPVLGLNTEYLSLFSPNAGKCGPEQLRIRTFFMQ